MSTRVYESAVGYWWGAEGEGKGEEDPSSVYFDEGGRLRNKYEETYVNLKYLDQVISAILVELDDQKEFVENKGIIEERSFLRHVRKVLEDMQMVDIEDNM